MNERSPVEQAVGFDWDTGMGQIGPQALPEPGPEFTPEIRFVPEEKKAAPTLASWWEGIVDKAKQIGKAVTDVAKVATDPEVIAVMEEKKKREKQAKMMKYGLAGLGIVGGLILLSRMKK